MAKVPRFFQGIHALRAVAAIYVVGEHATYVANHYTPIRMTSYGVILFFAISGFVIALQRTKTVSDFIRHRWLRIYPSYWLAMIVAATSLAIIHSPISASASSLLLYPSTVSNSTLTIPYWTLAFEITFYVIAAAVFWARFSDRTLTILALCWILIVNVVAAAPSVGVYTFPGFPAILWSPPVQVFPMGVICGIHFERLRTVGRPVLCAVAFVAFCVSFAFPEYAAHKLLFLGISAASLTLAVADLDLKSRLATTLGNASYGIYLLHFPAIIVAARVLQQHGLAWFFLYFAIGTAAGYVFGLLDCRIYRRLMSGPSWWERATTQVPLQVASETIPSARNQ
ncbi:acyltransferase family protein [Bradyrhizobium sp. GCM10028915]|uniref:acyltransferase family protein n=1 Tax=Bradyrhizobium sp. GCM10028915 TaxID=3273385 RepID=UPI0036070D34